MRLLIGAPVQRREWIIEKYLDHADMAAQQAGFTPAYLFVARPDDPTMGIVDEWLRDNLRCGYLEAVDEPIRPDRREWSPDRYQHMVDLRNKMLAAVRKIGPDIFLSLDTDILLSRDALAGGLEGLGRFDAVGLKVFLHPAGTDCPNYGNLVAGNLHRQDFDGFAPVEVIMAAKIMSPAAYNVDYSTHMHGEDIGWSLNCKEQGVTLGWDGRNPSKHVMNSENVEMYDRRIGW